MGLLVYWLTSRRNWRLRLYYIKAIITEAVMCFCVLRFCLIFVKYFGTYKIEKEQFYCLKVLIFQMCYITIHFSTRRKTKCYYDLSGTFELPNSSKGGSTIRLESAQPISYTRTKWFRRSVLASSLQNS